MFHLRLFGSPMQGKWEKPILSLLQRQCMGCSDVYRHCGVELAIAMLSSPKKSQILRQMRRFKNADFGHPENLIPCY